MKLVEVETGRYAYEDDSDGIPVWICADCVTQRNKEPILQREESMSEPGRFQWRCSLCNFLILTDKAPARS